MGVLLSGGLDSSILLGQLLRQGYCVRPFYIRAGLVWERAELAAVRRWLRALATPRLEKLVILDMPLADLYDGHWAMTGSAVPDAASADEAVYLPGRNALLTIKAALWCQLHGIERLALAVLASNPFADAQPEFFNPFQAALRRAHGGPLRIVRPFARLSKRQVMRRGAELPLELTFSCIAPVGPLHCGRCNKCAERQAAFAAAGLADRTRYAARELSRVGFHSGD
jgi:7-cyano-7-deazaguanine synthase